MGDKLSQIRTLPSRARQAALKLTESYEPDLSSETGAADFLNRLKALTTIQPQEGGFKSVLRLTGHRYYAFYAGLATVTLVIAIFPLLAYLPLGGRDLRWVVLSAGNTLLTVGLLIMLYKALLEFHAHLVGGGLGNGTDMRPAAGAKDEADVLPATSLTLRKCALELKYLIDTLNDRTGTLSHMLSYAIPALLFFYVTPLFLRLLLPSVNPVADNTPISVINFGTTFFYGMFAVLLLAPIRWMAHRRLTKYRFWLRSVDRLLLDHSE